MTLDNDLARVGQRFVRSDPPQASCWRLPAVHQTTALVMLTTETARLRAGACGGCGGKSTLRSRLFDV